MKRLLIFLGLTSIVICIDQYTKIEVIERFFLGETKIVIPGFFHLTYVRNTGGAFGFLAHSQDFLRLLMFILIPTASLFLMGHYFYKVARHSLLQTWALGLVLGGALGNLLDRFRLGFVVDFLDFFWGPFLSGTHFPAFNVADITICVGIGLLLLESILKPTPRKV